MTLITPDYARTLFADLTQNSAVPLDPDDLFHMGSLRRHGHVVIGDVALRCYKYKARWQYDERDVRRAARAYAEFRLDLGDVVDLQLPAYRDFGEREQDPEVWDRANWRRRLVWWMFGEARRKAVEEGRSDGEWDAWQRVGPNGLPGGLTMEEFVAGRQRSRLAQNIAGTKPLTLLSWSGENWLLPRAYAELLDRWEHVEEDLVARARSCSGCGAQGPRWGRWRTPTPKGYVTLCPPCSGAAFTRYPGHLRGVLYASLRNRTTRADDFLCRLCGESRASAWDHCHEHGFVRGPLCGGCNTAEGMGIPYYFLQREGSVLYLLECRGCLERRTLPRRFHTGVVRAHLEETERHRQRNGRRCERQPYAREVEHANGTYRFELECGWHTTGRWTKDITAAEVATLVRAFVDAALASQDGRPSPGAGGRPG
ncbi:endonuclease domain-containing protein [Streptomyces sp. NPDC001407]|uniref:endonuclease domain-containing protein n=1 Tax=Streptomyces sp. NPDC001407 TaxID=3364573 RepID=UPI0036A493D7